MKIAEVLKQAAPTLSAGTLTADMMDLPGELELLRGAGVKLVHFDIMDNTIWPKFTVGPPYVKGLKTEMLKDVHLLVKRPADYLEEFIAAGADLVVLHAESEGDLLALLKKIGEAENVNEAGRGIARGLGIYPGTSLDVLPPLLPELEVVSLIAVTPESSTLDAALEERAVAVREMASQAGREILLCIDGGIKQQTIGEAAKLKPDLVVSGSAVFDGTDAAANARQMLEAINDGES